MELMKELTIIDNCYMDNYWITSTTFSDKNPNWKDGSLKKLVELSKND